MKANSACTCKSKIIKPWEERGEGRLGVKWTAVGSFEHNNCVDQNHAKFTFL